MIRVEVQGLPQFGRWIETLARQARYAGARALNDTLFAARRAEQDAMARVFHRPTPYVQRGVLVEPATPQTLAGSMRLPTDRYELGVPPGKPLLAEVRGGKRRPKRSEVLLQRAGLLPRGWLTAPAPGAPRDAYGNLPIGQLLQILAWFRTYGERARSGKRLRSNFTDAGAARARKGTRNRSGFEYFVVRPGASRGGLHPGIYLRRLGGPRFVGAMPRVRAVLMFIERARYVARFPFRNIAAETVRREFAVRFAAQRGRALATAR